MIWVREVQRENLYTGKFSRRSLNSSPLKNLFSIFKNIKCYNVHEFYIGIFLTYQHIEIRLIICNNQRIAERGVPLFDSLEEDVVSIAPIGRVRSRKMFRQSEQMEAPILPGTDKLVKDWYSGKDNMMTFVSYVY